MTATLLYAGVPRFYAEVERAAHPELSDRPILVGGDPRKRGLVHAASEDALAEGVEVGMAVLDALARCPRARALPTDMRRYRDASAQLRACFRRVTDRVEPAGLGAASLDLAAVEKGPEEAARGLQREVAAELGLPLLAGIAPVKFVARLAAEEAGPDGVRRVRGAELARFLHPLPVGRLPGVGPNTEAELRELGVASVGDLARLGRSVLEERLGNHGLTILGYAQGRDPTRLRAAPHPRTLSQECTLAAPERDVSVLEERLQELAQGLASALERESLAARRVVLKLRFADREATTRSRTLPRLVRAPGPIARVAGELLARTQAGERGVRRLGLALGALATAAEDDAQLDLFS